MTTNPNLDQLTPEQLRTLTESLLVEVQQKDKTILHVQCQNDKLVHEIAILKRHKFARTRTEQDTHFKKSSQGQQNRTPTLRNRVSSRFVLYRITLRFTW